MACTVEQGQASEQREQCEPGLGHRQLLCACRGSWQTLLGPAHLGQVQSVDFLLGQRGRGDLLDFMP